MIYLSLLVSALLTTASAGPAVGKRQSTPTGTATTLEERASFFCPPGIDASLPLDAGEEAGLRFCSRLDRWSPATLYSSNPLNVGSGQYRLAASRCAALCTGICRTFSVAPSTPGNATFGCNLYNASVPFRGNTNGGLFYQRQNVSGAQLSLVTLTRTSVATVCPTPVPSANTKVTTITGPTSVTGYPVVYHPPGQQPTTVTASEHVITQTTTVTSTRTTVIDRQTSTVLVPVTRETVGPFYVFVTLQGQVTITEFANNVVTVVVVTIQGALDRPATTSTLAVAPTATPNSFQCPAGIVGQYQDTSKPASVFNLRFCSNTQRWSPADLFSSTPIADASYASAAQACSRRCNSTICQTFSVAPTTVGGSTFNCNLYNATNVFNGPTNGGLFYQRQTAPFVNDQNAAQCVGSLSSVSASGTAYTREFCSRTERWSPATLFDGTVQTGQSMNGVAPIVQAVQKCAARCAGFGSRCATFSTTFTEQNPPTGDAGVPVNFNCNIYNATLRVLGNTQGGAFYRAQSSGFNATAPAVKRFIH